MATKREEIIGVLAHVDERDIEIKHGKDTIHVKIKMHARNAYAREAAGKWARFADDVHAESPLKGQSKQLNTLICAFRDEFSFNES